MRAGVLWTNLSLRRLRQALAARGFRVSVKVVTQLLARHQLGRRKALKKRSLKHHPQQDRQFQIITHYRQLYEAAGNPILSIDTKKKELLGNLFREGHAYTQKVVETLDHDFPSLASGVLYPHGLYDLQRNHGHLNVGTSHDTSAFACDSLAYWWEHFGQSNYPRANSLLLLCDGGGSNAANRYIFKYGLERLAERLSLEIRVCHYPPYESKYNPIEHRFFPHVTRACGGVIFETVETALGAMAAASTTTGLYLMRPRARHCRILET
jgi:Rhodopirellula transposase DDE domain